MNSTSPSFTGTSSNNLADIAARVVAEYRNETGHDDDDVYDNFTEDDVNRVYYDPTHNELNGNGTDTLKENDQEEQDEEGEFEFAVVYRNPNLSVVSADEMFSNGEIVPRYPLFDQSLLLNDVSLVSPVVRNSLGKLFEQEREPASVSSEVEINLVGVEPETYCIWKPKVESPERCKKSKSTGNGGSKRWKFKNLLQRSNSDGNMAAGSLTAARKRGEKVKKIDNTAKVAGADDDGELMNEIESGNKMNKGGNRIRSYLRFKKDQFGL